MMRVRGLFTGKLFYGWIVTAAAFVTLGLAVGLPYYNIPFFYDYFAKAFHWTTPQITLGFPLAALPTVVIGPLLIHRFSPRKLILCGTVLTCGGLIWFGLMGPNVWIYRGIWVVFTTGYILSGPIPHQIIIAQWFRKNRGMAMGIIYVGLGFFGFLGSYVVKPLTENLDFHCALMILGGFVALAWPLAFFVLRDRPAEKGVFPDGAGSAPAEISAEPFSYRFLISRYSFWLLVLGSTCSIGAIGSVNILMKLVFQAHMTIPQSNPAFQPLLNSTWRAASMIILGSSIAGRIAIGAFSDYFSKKWVMTISYFLSAVTIPMLLSVKPPATPWLFATLFGIAMSADYMLIPLMAAEQFGVRTLARAMAIILPANTIGQTWFPYFTSVLKQHWGNYTEPMYLIFGVALLSGISIALLPAPELIRSQEPLPNLYNSVR
ncbi:MAG: MFS transporter [Acidobacteriaceae bacterium]|nr:MFS transporter [Acidobacteriaceae bacterium]